MLRFISLGLVAAVCIGPGRGAADSMAEQAIILGKSSYNAYCVDCHGENAKGDGPFADYLTVKPADLTQLTQEAGGAFPFSEAYRIIDGTRTLRTHMLSSMPIWGDAFMTDTLADRGMSADHAEEVVQGRILALVHYLESIQE